MSQTSWTPAPKPGLIPLRPLGFGTVLGKSFAALRHNPKVLFGFAVIVQLVVLIVVFTVVGVVAVTTLSRLDTVRRGSDEWLTLTIGSAAFILGAGLLMGLFSVAFTAIVQGIVAADVRAAVLRERATLGVLWARVRPAAWRLIGYTLLYGLAAGIVVVLTLGLPFLAIALPSGFDNTGIGLSSLIAVLLGLPALLALSIWIGTKLMLVPSLLVLEGAGVRDAITRSWRLTRGRFWFAFGVVFVIGLIMYVVTQAISTVGSLILSLSGPVFNPTGLTDQSIGVGTIVGLVITEILVVILQSISSVVQSTAAALIYIDCRMRYEGLDQDLMTTIERRAAGADDGSDPFRMDPARAVRAGFRPPRPVVPYPLPPGPVPGYPAPSGYVPGYPSAPGAPYAGSPYSAPAPPPPHGGAQAPHGAPRPGDGAPPVPYGAPAGPAAPPPSAPIPPAQRSPWARPDDGWTAPGSDRP